LAPMDPMSRTCPDCEAELAPGERFCPRCGGWASVAAPGAVPDGQPAAGWAPAPAGGPGRTVAALPAPARPGRATPRAALPAPPPAAGARPDWGPDTVPRSGYPLPPGPYQQPPPVTRVEPAAYQAPLPPQWSPASPPPAYPPAAQQPAGYPPSGYPADSGYPTASAYPPAGYPAGPARGPGTFEPLPPGQGPLPPAGPPQSPRQPPRRHDRDRRGVPSAVLIAALVLIAGGAVALLLAHPFSHPGGQGSTGTASGASAGAGTGGTASRSPATPARGTASKSAAAVTEQQAATSVATMLSASASDRAATSAAASDIASCGPHLTTDPAVFGRAVSSRQALLSHLAAMPGRATLPPALITDLTKAWQASVAADQAYTRWADDEIAKRCVPDDTTDPGYQATTAPNQQATSYKTQFAAAWDPIAARYGLTQYQPGQL
jgi:hypothetical protein